MASGLKEPAPLSKASARKGDSPLLRIVAEELKVRPFELDKPTLEKERLPSLAKKDEKGRDEGAPGLVGDMRDAGDALSALPQGVSDSVQEEPFDPSDRGSAPTPSPSTPDSGLISDAGTDTAVPARVVPVTGAASLPALDPGVRTGDPAIGPGQLSRIAGKQLLTGKLPPPPITTTAPAPTPLRTAPTSALAPPLAANPRQKDRNGNRIDDRLDALLRQTEEKRSAPQQIRILVTLSRPYTQDQLKAFLELGGEVRHTFEAVRYGFSGLLQSDRIDDLAVRLGSELTLIELVLPIPGAGN